MAESLALSKKKQKSFSSSVQNYKKLLKKGDIKITEKSETPNKKKKTFKSTRGVVYLGNVPHGFYEEQMTEYFGQFGAVTNIRLARSKNTGKSKGFAFIEYRVPEVAKIVAETMDRYLMGKRLLKAQYIPPKEQTKNYFKGRPITENWFPKKTHRIKNIQSVNNEISEAKEAAACKRMLANVEKVQKQLKSAGIDYKFEPVEIPDFMKLDKNIADSDGDVSDMDSEDSDDIVFQPPPKTLSKQKKKNISATVPVPPKTKSFNKKNKANVTQEKEKVKLGGVAKKSAKSKKPKAVETIEAKKIDMIKSQILNSDQVNVKSAKDLKANKKGDKNNKSPKGKKGKKGKK